MNLFEQLTQKIDKHNIQTSKEWGDYLSGKLNITDVELSERQSNRSNSIRDWYNKQLGFNSI